MSGSEDQPGFGVSIAAVLVAGLGALWLLSLVPASLLRTDARYALASAVAGVGVKLLLHLAGYRVPYLLAVAALLAGGLVGLAARYAIPSGDGPALPGLPGLGAVALLPSLLVSVGILRLSASGGREEPAL